MSIFSSEKEKVRIAVVGLGYIAQAAALPAFEKTENCEIAALVSSDQEKLKELGENYGVDHLFRYEEYADCLALDDIDAVYISLPNNMHRDFVIQAARAGKHILCEKPMAVRSEDCREMIQECERANVKLMIAYRLHFETVNMGALNSIQAGQIGEVRLVSGTFGQQVKPDDIRTKHELGGGALYDMGIYCLNAARYFFQSEPKKVVGLVSRSDDPRFQTVDGYTGAILDFGDGKIASLLTSIGCGEISSCIVVGDKGTIKLDPAFDFQVALESTTTVEGEETDSQKAKTDQFAGQLQRFAEYILNDEPVEPDGYQGLADLLIMESILRSSRTGEAIELNFDFDPRRPNPGNIQEFSLRGSIPTLVNAAPPTK